MSSQQQILHFPLGGIISLAPNVWQVWSGQEECANSMLPDLEQGSHNVLVPFTWWIANHQNPDVLAKAKNGQIGVWFATVNSIGP